MNESIKSKVFGIGMSKTGTSTLGACFRVLGLMPTIGFRNDLKQLVRGSRLENPINGKFAYDPECPLTDTADLNAILNVAANHQSFQDSPWYMLYRDLDRAFPGSKFILTTRRNSRVQALSDWHHNQSLGKCTGEPPECYISEQIRIYETHNRCVQKYFHGREPDLLTVCWENGDGWAELCRFLNLARPDVAFPHERKGRYSNHSR